MEKEVEKFNLSETPAEKTEAVQKIDWSSFDPEKRDIYIENQRRENNALASFQSVTDAAGAQINPYLKFQQHGVNYGASNRGGVNLERYYNRDEFKRLGFNPFGDNEMHYQLNTDFWDDFRVARQQFTSLFKLGIWSYFSDEDQYTKAERYARAANIGTSQRENTFSRNFNNLVLNSGYTLGLMTGILLEEVPLFFVTGGTGNLVKAPKTAFTIGKITKLADTAKDVGDSIRAVRQVQKVSNARQFWQGAGNVASELVPFKTTGDLLINWKRIGTATDKGTELLDTGAKLQRLFGSFYRDGREILLAYDESKLESGMIYNDIMDDMILDFKTEKGRLPTEAELSDLSRIAKEQENRTFIKNMGAIYLTNRISFGNAFNRMNPRLVRQGSKTIYQNSAGKIKADLSNNKVKAVMKEGFLNVKGAGKEFFNNVRNIRHTWKPGLMYLGKGSLKYTRANFGEGIQEWIQETVQEAEKFTGMDIYDNYKKGLRGAALDDALGSSSFFQNYGKAASHFMSAEGFEIFASGFLMGGVAGPYMGMVSRVPNVLSQMSEYATKESREKRLETMIKSRKILEEKVEQFNKLTDKEQEHIYNYILQAGRQASYKQQMDDAEEEGNDKMFYDVKDKALGDYILNALSSGTYDLFVAQLKDMLELSDTEFAEAFKEQLNFENVEELQGLKARAQDIIESAENIRNLYDQVNNIFPEFIDVTDQDEEFYGDLSLRDLKAVRDQYIQQIVLHQYQLDRNLQRTQKLLNSLSGENSPFRDVSNIGTATVAPLLSSQIMDNELQRLQDEIKSLKEIIKSDKEAGTPTKTKERELTTRENKLKRLTKINTTLDNFINKVQYLNLLEQQQKILKSDNVRLMIGQSVTFNVKGEPDARLGTVVDTVTKDGVTKLKVEYLPDGESEKKTIEIDITEQTIEELNVDTSTDMMKISEEAEEALREYLFFIAKEGDTTVDFTKMEGFIKAFLDSKLLKSEESDLADVVMTLTSPGVYADYMAQAIQQRKKLGKFMKASVKRDLEQYYKTAEKNLLVQTLVQKHSAFLRADDLANILDDGMEATYKAFDVNTLEEILPGTERFLAINAEIVEFIENSKEAKETTEESKADEQVSEEEVEVEDASEETEEVYVELSLDSVLKTPLDQLPENFKTILSNIIKERNEALLEATGEVSEMSLDNIQQDPLASPVIAQALQKYKDEFGIIKPTSTSKVKLDITDTQSDIDAKKAEIKRRRQDSQTNQLKEVGSNRFLKFNEEGENTELTKVELKLINSLIDRMISAGNTAKEIDAELRSRGYTQSSATTAAEVQTYLQSRIDGKINAKVGESISDEINAKYDAELKALEEVAEEDPAETGVDFEEETSPEDVVNVINLFIKTSLAGSAEIDLQNDSRITKELKPDRANPVRRILKDESDLLSLTGPVDLSIGNFIVYNKRKTAYLNIQSLYAMPKDVQNNPFEYGYTSESTELNTFKAELPNGDVYYAPTEDMALFLEGKLSADVRMKIIDINTSPYYGKEVVNLESKAVKELESKASELSKKMTIDNYEQILEELTAAKVTLGLKFKIDINTQVVEEMLQNKFEELKSKVKPSDFMIGELYQNISTGTVYTASKQNKNSVIFTTDNTTITKPQSELWEMRKVDINTFEGEAKPTSEDIKQKAAQSKETLDAQEIIDQVENTVLADESLEDLFADTNLEMDC